MATVASGLNGGAGYNSSDTITSTTLNDHVNDATVTDIGNADIASNAAVAVTKLETITSQNVLGNIGAGNASVPIVGATGLLLDEDDLSTDSDTKGATQQSIKAYVDAEIDTTIGHNQTWQNFYSIRSNNVVYQNTTGKPIQVAISHGPTGNTTQLIQVSADNSTWINICQLGFDASESASCFIVPNNHYYRTVGNLPQRTWSELR